MEILTHATTQMNPEDMNAKGNTVVLKGQYCVIPFLWGP